MDGNTFAFRLPPEVRQDEVFVRKFRLERELGTGGMGIVYAAHHIELDERVAIKFLLPEPAQDADAVARFRREARAAIKIKNEHVVRMIDCSTTESGIPYIVMEYLDGTNLDEMLERSLDRRLPVTTMVDFILQACEALAEGHCRGIIHRDLKPANIFCVQGADGLPLIKVLDFGISKMSRPLADTATTEDHRILGSPRYMSPEQMEGVRDVDARTDIWAIGVLLYEGLTGQPPFVGASFLQLSHRIRFDAPIPPGALSEAIPPPLEAVITRCLAKERADRYANLADLAKALSPFAPERARPSIARIVRTLESPGRTTAALGLAELSDDAPASGSTTARVWRKIRTKVVLLVAAGIAIGVVAVRAAVSAKSAPLPTVTPVPALREAPVEVPSATLLYRAAGEPLPVATPSASTATRPRPRSLAPATVVASAPIVAKPVELQPAPPATASPWIVDIVEKRKP